MVIATFLGININDFWETTPKELSLAMMGFTKRKESEAEEYQIKLRNDQRLMTIQAYQISRWVWAKEIDINKILKETQPKQEMTDEQMLKQVQLLNSLFGGEVSKDGTE